ncbi:MAG: dephospho-CoA kinase [Gemmataceae bacterium]
MDKSAKPVIGLVGGIGSGKSLVAGAFARRGGRILSGDQYGHEALRQPVIKENVVARWGKDLLDEQGEVIRRKLGKIVFGKEEERKALEELVFPFIEKRIVEEIEAARRDDSVKVIVLDAAIMLETGWNKVCDWIVYVHGPRRERLKRLAEQRGWTAEEVEARESAQLPLTQKILQSDYVIDNSDTPEETARQVDDLLAELLESRL